MVTRHRHSAIIMDWGAIQQIDDTESIFCLTRQQATALLGITEYLGWFKRWENTGSDDWTVIHDFKFAIQTRLLNMDCDICAPLADCIDNNGDVHNALNTFLQNNGYGTGGGNPELPLSDGTLEENLLPDGYTCSNDAAFGMSVAIVDSINEAVTEVLEAIEILTNPLELVAELADNVPGFGVLAAGGDVINWIQDTAKENYDAAWSTVVRDELACRIWCEFKADCDLSFDTIWGVYLDESGIVPPTETDLESWLLWLIDIIFIDNLQTVSTVSLLGLLAMRYGGKFGEFVLGIRSLQMIMRLSEDETNSDWDILCDDCPNIWCVDTDFTINDGGWVLPPSPPHGAGIYGGSGWAHDDIILPSGQRRRTVHIEHPFTSSEITTVKMIADFTIGFYQNTGAAVVIALVDTGSGTNVYQKDNTEAAQGTNITYEWNDPAGETADKIRLFFRSSYDDDSPYVFEGNVLLKSVQICGQDPQPPEL